METRAKVAAKEERHSRSRAGAYCAAEPKMNPSDPAKLVSGPVIAAVNSQEAFEEALSSLHDVYLSLQETLLFSLEC